MIKKLFPNLPERVKTEFLLLSPSNLAGFFFYLLILFLPTQFGKHFWPDFSFVYGLRLDYLSPTIYLTDIFIFLVLVFFAPSLVKALGKISKKYLLIYLLFSLGLCVGIFYSKNIFAGLYGIIKYFEFSFLAFYVYQNIKKFNKTILFYCFAGSLILESLLSFLQYINQGSIGSLFYFLGERQYFFQTPGIANASINGELILRPYATFSHPNALGGFLVLSMILLLVFLKDNQKEKVVLVTSLVLGTISLLLSLSRVSIVAWSLCLFFLFCIAMYKKYKKEKSNKKYTMPIIASAVMGLFFVFQSSLFVQRILSTSLSEESVTQRGDLFNQATLMFKNNPVFGVGLNNFFNNLNPFSQKIFLIQPVHNIFILTLSETGVIGFLFLTAIFVLGLTRIISLKGNMRNYLICLFFAVCFLGMFDHYFLTLQQGQLLFVIVLAVLLSGKKLS